MADAFADLLGDVEVAETEAVPGSAISGGS